MSHHCEPMLNTAVELGVDAVTLASDPCYVLGAQIGQVILTTFTRFMRFFSVTHTQQNAVIARCSLKAFLRRSSLLHSARKPKESRVFACVSECVSVCVCKCFLSRQPQIQSN